MTDAVIKSNALQAKSDILSQSHLIKEMVDSGKLEILTGAYDIKTGKVEWFNKIITFSFLFV